MKALSTVSLTGQLITRQSESATTDGNVEQELTKDKSVFTSQRRK